MIENTPAAWDERAAEPEQWRASLWSEDSQRRRFFAVRELLAGGKWWPRTDTRMQPNDVLLDYGCGTGAFCELLPLSVEYVGYDWSPAMRARARRDYSPRGVIIDDFDGEPAFDYVVCIGPFNLKDGWSKERTFETVEELWGMTEKAMVVSLYRGRRDPSMLVYSLADVAKLAARLGAHELTVTTEHLSNDLLARFSR